MIAVATFGTGVFGRLVMEGACSYALTHNAKRWRNLTGIPNDMLVDDSLRYHQLTGLIIAIADQNIRQQVFDLHIPAVNISGTLNNPGFPSIILDNHRIGQLAAEYFLDRGYHNFAYAPAASLKTHYAAKRGDGFASVLHAAGFPLSWYGDFPEQLPPNAIRSNASITEWLISLPKPVAIFTPQDSIAAEVHAAATSAQLNIPDQVAILGVDNDPNVHFGILGISSVEPPFRQLGYEAAALLDRILDGENSSDSVTLLPPGKVVTRSSTDTRAIGDPLVVDALKYIREHACEGIRVDDVVVAVPTSKRSLQRRFVASLGSTITDVLTRTRVAHARKLLTYSSMQIKEISDASGFGDRKQFFLAFRAATGQSPSDFRAAHHASDTMKST